MDENCNLPQFIVNKISFFELNEAIHWHRCHITCVTYTFYK